MGGVPCLRGLRIPVATIVGLIAEGQTTQDILVLYPDLDADDVREALLFAAEAVRELSPPVNEISGRQRALASFRYPSVAGRSALHVRTIELQRAETS
jgi:uncharacterized protein (DUF433 family)